VSGPEIRFAVVGTGMGASRARTCAETPGACLQLICSLDTERGERLSKELGCAFTSNFDEALARDDIDAVGVMTPSGTHCDFAIRALKAGKHVFTTKPMDISVEKCTAAIETAREANRILAVDFDSRYNPINHQIRMAVRSNRLGRIILCDLRMKWLREQSYYDGGVPTAWRSKRRYEGGSSANQGVHYIDLMQWWLGPIRSVTGRCGTFNHEIETEDCSNALVTFHDGSWGIIQTTTANYPDLGTVCELSGTSGTLRWVDNKIEMLATRDGTFSLDDFTVDSNLPNNIFEDMIQAITKGTKPQVDGMEGRKTVEIFNAIYRSSETGNNVELQHQ
jgi:UDP-N-acetyl-2-amino-2-deoxyglucuronate dehydrogenase